MILEAAADGAVIRSNDEALIRAVNELPVGAGAIAGAAVVGASGFARKGDGPRSNSNGSTSASDVDLASVDMLAVGATKPSRDTVKPDRASCGDDDVATVGVCGIGTPAVGVFAAATCAGRAAIKSPRPLADAVGIVALAAVSPSKSDNCASTLTPAAGNATSGAVRLVSKSDFCADALDIGPNDGSMRDDDVFFTVSIDDGVGAADRGAKNGSEPNSDNAAFCGDALR